jgi:hypothetical protein
MTVGGHLNEPKRTDFSVEKGPSWSLVRELRERGIDSLYANYWTAYLVTFASERAVVATPFGLWRLTRFPADRSWVDGSSAPAILLGRDEAAFLERFLEGTRYRREELGGDLLFTGIDPSRLAVLRGLHCVPGQEGCR